MSKVYIAIGGYTYETDILGVFANREDACECCRKVEEEEEDDLYITVVREYEVR